MSTIESGRFKLVTDRRELALPSNDFFTGSSTEEFYIDTDCDTDNGRINIGATTMRQLAALIGYVPQDNTVQDRLNKLELENRALRSIIRGSTAAAVDFVRALNNALDEVPDDELRAKLAHPSNQSSRRNEPASKSDS